MVDKGMQQHHLLSQAQAAVVAAQGAADAVAQRAAERDIDDSSRLLATIVALTKRLNALEVLAGIPEKTADDLIADIVAETKPRRDPAGKELPTQPEDQ